MQLIWSGVSTARIAAFLRKLLRSRFKFWRYAGTGGSLRGGGMFPTGGGSVLLRADLLQCSVCIVSGGTFIVSVQAVFVWLTRGCAVLLCIWRPMHLY